MAKRMKLHWSPRSPFVRKVMIALHETQLLDQVDLVRSLVALQLPPNPEVLADNPLGKIPALVTQTGQVLFDSRVICEYLDHQAGTNLFPSDPVARLDQLRWQALADGLTDILLIWRTELLREAGPWADLTQGWQIKVRATMERLENEVTALRTGEFGIGTIAVICALGQMDMRWADCAWRSHFPQLADWLSEMDQRPSVQATRVIDDQSADADDVTKGQLRFV